MFAFHETTRKRICRTAFFALCVAPTLATGLWIASHYMPGARGRTARVLGDVLDVHVKLADWRYPRPRTVRSAGITLSDPASGSLLAELSRMEAKQGGEVRALTVKQVRVDASQLLALGGKVDRWLAKLPPQTQEIVIDSLVVTLPSDGAGGGVREFVLSPVRGRVDRDAAGRARVRILAQVAGLDASDAAVQLTLEPSTESGSASASVTLDARGAEIPASLLAAVAPGFGSFGTESQFMGVVQWTLDRPLPRGVVQGRLENADMASILPAGAPHSLRGRATIELQELSWRGARLERLAGSLHAEKGQISRSLVDALAKNFQCGATDGVLAAEDPTMLSLDLLAVRFEMDASGLTLWGDCPAVANLPTGCMAVSGSQPLLVQSPFDKWHLGVLVQTLAAPGVTWMPATDEAVDLAERLPLPRK